MLVPNADFLWFYFLDIQLLKYFLEPTISINASLNLKTNRYVGEEIEFSCHASEHLSLNFLILEYREHNFNTFVGCKDGYTYTINTSSITIQGPDNQNCMPTSDNITEFNFTAKLNVTADLVNGRFQCIGYDRAHRHAFFSNTVDFYRIVGSS